MVMLNFVVNGSLVMLGILRLRLGWKLRNCVTLASCKD